MMQPAVLVGCADSRALPPVGCADSHALPPVGCADSRALPLVGCADSHALPPVSRRSVRMTAAKLRSQDRHEWSWDLCIAGLRWDA